MHVMCVCVCIGLTGRGRESSDGAPASRRDDNIKILTAPPVMGDGGSEKVHDHYIIRVAGEKNVQNVVILRGASK